MMRAGTLFALLQISLAGSCLAAPLDITQQEGSPAIEGDGSSSTTVSIIGGTGSVTVESTGSTGVYTHSGTVDGSGSVGIPQIGIEAGGGLSNAGGDGDGGGLFNAGGDGDGGGLFNAGGDGGQSASPGLDEGDTSNSPTPNRGADVTGRAQGNANGNPDNCDDIVPDDSASLVAIAVIRDRGKVAIEPLCANDTRLDAATRRAIEKNDVLVAALAAAGFMPADVLQVQSTARRSAILFVSARD